MKIFPYNSRVPQDENQLRKWRLILEQNNDKMLCHNKESFICSLHFQANDFISAGKRKYLRYAAVPQIIKPAPTQQM